MCPEGNQIRISTDSVIMEFVEPSKSLSGIGIMECVGTLYLQTKVDSIKLCVELESMRFEHSI